MLVVVSYFVVGQIDVFKKSCILTISRFTPSICIIDMCLSSFKSDLVRFKALMHV